LRNPIFDRTGTTGGSFFFGRYGLSGYSQIAGSGWRGGASTLAGDSGSAGSGKRGGSGIPFARKSHAARDE